MLAIGGGVTFVVLMVIAAIGGKWVEWLGNLAIALLIGALFGMFLERIAIRPMVGQLLTRSSKGPTEASSSVAPSTTGVGLRS